MKIDNHTYRYETHRTSDLLMCVAASSQASNDTEWLSVVSYTMQKDSQHRLAERLYDREDPFSGLGLFVLANRIVEHAAGIPLIPAATLAASAIYGWFPFAAWCAAQGTPVDSMRFHTVLPAVYGWLTHSCAEQKDLDKLNRRVFGSSKPW